jgi:hypothetical protein
VAIRGSVPVQSEAISIWSLGSINRAARCSAVRPASDDWNAILVVLEQEIEECVPLR